MEEEEAEAERLPVVPVGRCRTRHRRPAVQAELAVRAAGEPVAPRMLAASARAEPGEPANLVLRAAVRTGPRPEAAGLPGPIHRVPEVCRNRVCRNPGHRRAPRPGPRSRRKEVAGTAPSGGPSSLCCDGPS